MKNYLSQFLFESIPNFLIEKLTIFIGSKNGLSTNLSKVYDIVNSGPQRRFAVKGNSSIISLAHNCVQATAHDVQMLHIHLTREMLDHQEGVRFEWVVADWHDQLIIEVREEDAERAAEFMMTKVLPELNRRLGGMIYLRGDAQIGDNLWEVK